MRDLPIFVTGCQRSGTSLLRRVLDSHSRIACPPESAFLVQLARVVEVERALQGLRTMGFTDRDVLREMRRFTSTFFETYAARNGKARWADKTTPYLDHVDTIERMFEERVAYVGIVRHGLDVAESLSQFEWGVLQPYFAAAPDRRVGAARFWRDQNRKLLAFRERTGDRFHLVRYEELTKDPRRVLRDMFAFLGEPWEEAVLAYNQQEHDRGFEDANVEKFERIEPNEGKYRQWPRAVQESAFAEAREMMDRLGYAWAP